MTHDNTQSDVVAWLYEKKYNASDGFVQIVSQVDPRTETHAVGSEIRNVLPLVTASLSTKDSDAVLEERWQPIETAPKGDGQYGPDILLWQAGAPGEQKIGMFHWFVDGFVTNSWEHDPALNPTHWMPLPDSPAAIRKGRPGNYRDNTTPHQCIDCNRVYAGVYRECIECGGAVLRKGDNA